MDNRVDPTLPSRNPTDVVLTQSGTSHHPKHNFRPKQLESIPRLLASKYARIRPPPAPQPTDFGASFIGIPSVPFISRHSDSVQWIGVYISPPRRLLKKRRLTAIKKCVYRQRMVTDVCRCNLTPLFFFGSRS